MRRLLLLVCLILSTLAYHNATIEYCHHRFTGTQFQPPGSVEGTFHITFTYIANITEGLIAIENE